MQHFLQQKMAGNILTYNYIRRYRATTNATVMQHFISDFTMKSVAESVA
jgi:hypothetical protein